MIEVKGLYKGYETDGNYVVKDMNIKVEKGTIHGLIGHNGSGKTTIIKCLTGIYPPDFGEVLIKGKPVYENPKVKEIIGYVADSNQMFSGYKISQLAKMYDNMFINFSMDDFRSLNRIFQVNVNKRINQLSKGQQMRVSFMLNLARNPEVMILDEPTSGLDAIAKKDLLDCLVSAVENQGMTVLISSHHLSELEKICDSVTVIKNGQVHIDDELDEVTGQVMKFQVVFTQGAPSELYNRKDVIHMSNVGSVYTVIVPKSSTEFPGDMKSLGAVLVEEMPVGLEESFVYMNRSNVGGEGNA
ncbi:MAG: ABC transporter ATP-binding protein [Eubacterium sp.]|nr:ABC transporter ATP-binding protein [Eubacterium sp.]